MATVIVEDGDQTALASCGMCIRCGQPSDRLKNHKFTWYPLWVSTLAVVGLLFCLPMALVVVLAGTRRKWLKVPVCERHAGHWMWRLMLIPLFTLLGVIAFGVLAVLLITAQVPVRLGPGPGGNIDPGGLACFGVIVLGLVWLVMVSVLQSGSIRPLEISDTGITLTNVSEDFARTFRDELRRPGLVVDDYVREHWGRGKGQRPRPAGHEGIQKPGDGPEEPPPDAVEEAE